MVRKLAWLVVLAALWPLGAGASAEIYVFRGNDTGGIIPWSPESRAVAREVAADHCAQYFKRARITSVIARPGNYIAFKCFFDRHYDPVKWWVRHGKPWWPYSWRRHY